jgi:hypothetical protein
MPGNVLPIGQTNPKKGAVQFDLRRIDGVPFVITSSATITSAPVGSIVTLQENSSGTQKIVLGAAAYAPDEYTTYTVLAIGTLEAATQANGNLNPTVGEFSHGDIVTMVSDPDAAFAAPYDTGNKPTAGSGKYVTPDGKLSSASSSNVAFPGVVWYGTSGVQASNQLASGYVFARIKFSTLA